MKYEVVVVGGGIGGLVTAALLARRGVKVCLLERQSRVGGCIANLEHLGFEFEPTYGLYRGFGSGEIFDRVFEELDIAVPQTKRLSPAYVVRLQDRSDIPISSDVHEFEGTLRREFRECAEASVNFYRTMTANFGTDRKNRGDSLSGYFANCSLRFRNFIDAQLQTFLQCSSEDCSFATAAAVLDPRTAFYSIEGSAQRLADSLAESLKQNGGVLRLDTPALRLAYGSDGSPIGVDLLTGEQVIATKAIISSLTIWDTYGKLIGIGRTPRDVSSYLRNLRSYGAYQMFLSMEDEAVGRLPPRRFLALTASQEDEQLEPFDKQFFVSCGDRNQSTSEGKVPVTVTTFTNAEDWFSFHEDHTTHEEHDQRMLEAFWSRMHAAMPELGNAVEVIETANPQTFYETTRRKFGMIGRPRHLSATHQRSYTTPFPNVFIVSDTNSIGVGIASVAESALGVADALTNRH